MGMNRSSNWQTKRLQRDYEETMFLLAVAAIAKRLNKSGLPNGDKITEHFAMELVHSRIDVKQNLQKQLFSIASELGVNMQNLSPDLADWLNKGAAEA